MYFSTIIACLQSIYNKYLKTHQKSHIIHHIFPYQKKVIRLTILSNRKKDKIANGYASLTFAL